MKQSMRKKDDAKYAILIVMAACIVYVNAISIFFLIEGVEKCYAVREKHIVHYDLLDFVKLIYSMSILKCSLNGSFARIFRLKRWDISTASRYAGKVQKLKQFVKRACRVFVLIGVMLAMAAGGSYWHI